MRLVAQQEGNEDQMEVWQPGKVRFQAELLERGQGFTILLGDQGKASCEAKWNNVKEASEREMGTGQRTTRAEICLVCDKGVW